MNKIGWKRNKNMAAPSLGTIQNLVTSFNWHTPSWDLFVLGFWIVASVIFAFAAGRGRVLSVLVSTYVAQLLVIKAPFLTDALAQKTHIDPAFQQLVVFGALFLVSFIFIGRYAFKTSADSKSITSLPFTVLFSLLQTGLLINIVLNYLPEKMRESFSSLIQLMFLHPTATFVWLALPVVFLVILGRFIANQEDV